MLKSMISTAGDNAALAGGTISGDLTITGDLKVEGGGSFSFDEIIEGTQVIEKTATEAFLVRKDSDGGDVGQFEHTVLITDGGPEVLTVA